MEEGGRYEDRLQTRKRHQGILTGEDAAGTEG